jgi:hypothetical protein
MGKAMGIGLVGNPDITFKRVFRFTFEIRGFCNNQSSVIPEHFVMTAGRPKLEVEETQIDHLNARTWIPGKASWQTITVKYMDVAHATNVSLWTWMATIYSLGDPVNLTMGNKRDWDATGVLNMWDGCGVLLETWYLQHMWPTSIDFGDLDYGSSDIATTDLTLRYSDVLYKSYCPEFTPIGCCTGCGSGERIL